MSAGDDEEWRFARTERVKVADSEVENGERGDAQIARVKAARNAAGSREPQRLRADDIETGLTLFDFASAEELARFFSKHL